MVTVDHSGETHYNLTLLKKGEPYIAPKTGKKKQRYYCSCSCGKYTKDNPKLILYEKIISGRTRSCGCLQKEYAIETISNYNENNKKYNTYDLSGEFGIGYTLKGEEFYFDLEDYDLIKDYCWYRTTYDYVIAKTLDGSGSHITLHRLLFPNAQKVDHIKHINYDNRKSQLRPVTSSQNMMNRKNNKNNISGCKGVSWDKRKNKWIAHISANKNKYQKEFKNFDDAVEQRKKWENEYFGEYGYDNSMKAGV